MNSTAETKMAVAYLQLALDHMRKAETSNQQANHFTNRAAFTDAIQVVQQTIDKLRTKIGLPKPTETPSNHQKTVSATASALSGLYNKQGQGTL